MYDQIERFLLAVREFGDRVAELRDSEESEAGLAHSLAMIATGGFWLSKYDEGEEEALELARRGEDTTEYSEARLRDWLNHLVSERRMLTTFLVTGLVRHIEAEFEEVAEDGSQARKRAREERADLEAKLADPDQADQVIAEMNAARLFVTDKFGFPPRPPVTRENLLEDLERLHQRFVPPATLEELKKHRERLDAWREIVVPILQERSER